MSITHTAPECPRNTTIPLQFLWREGLCLVVLLALQRGPSFVGAVTLALLLCWAMRSNRAAMQALTISVLLAYLNPTITMPQSMTSQVKWVLLFLTCAVCIYRTYRLTRIPRWLPVLGVFTVVTGVLALVTSAQADLSLFKLFSFTAGAVAALTVFQGASQEPGYARNWLFTVFTVVLCLSLPMIVVPGGYLSGFRMFRGILAHSQSYAIFMIPMVMYLFARTLTGEATPLVEKAMIAIGFLTIIATGSRTAVLAAVGGLLMVGLIVACYRADLRHVFTRLRSLVVLAMLVAGGLVQLVVSKDSPVEGGLRFFLAKNRTASKDMLSAEEAFTSSRGAIVDLSMQNFRQQPLIGVGFGMNSPEGVGMVVRDPILGLPVSAPIEQGFLPTATLGQVGLIGSILLLTFLVVLFRPILQYAPAPILVLFWVAFLVNFGEMIFYSTGGLGLYMWLILGFCHEESLRARQ